MLTSLTLFPVDIKWKTPGALWSNISNKTTFEVESKSYIVALMTRYVGHGVIRCQLQFPVRNATSI